MTRSAGFLLSLLCLAAALAAGCGDDDGADGDAGTDSDTDSDTGGDTDTATDPIGDSGVDTDTGTDTGTDTEGAPAIAGDWIDDWGNAHSVTADAWTTEYPGEGDAGTTTSVTHVTSWSNDDAGFGVIVGQNDAVDSFYPGLWSRYDWAYADDEELYFCQIEFAAADEETAATNDGADRADLDAGCGGYPWSHLTAM